MEDRKIREGVVKDKTSVIIAFKDKPDNLRRCLQSWSNVLYSDLEIILVDDGSKGDYSKLLHDFSHLKFQHHRLESHHDRTPAVAFNFGFRKSCGDFVIFTDEDLIFNCWGLIYRMKSFYSGSRVNLKTYFLTEVHTKLLDDVSWPYSGTKIEDFPGFWEHYRYDAETTNQFLHDHWQNPKVTFLTGQYRKDWEYIGLFREDKIHLTRDQDLEMRENALGKIAQTLPEIPCFHQYHPFPDVYVGPGYRYENEQQARLLEPAPHE